MPLDLPSSKYRCPNCGGADFSASTTRWRCGGCGHDFLCVAGMPKLFVEERLGAQDRKLRDWFYDGVFGRFYQFMMPFIVMPVRPWAISWPHWLVYAATCLAFLALLAGLGWSVAEAQAAAGVAMLAALVAIGWFLVANRYLAFLLVLALPLRLSLLRRPYRPAESFAEAHARVLAALKARGERLQVLDVSTGSCNSLYRHGWMTLDADYTAIDLSETMLRQGADFMGRAGVPVDLVIGDAVELPFQSDRFDVVLSYGAVNGLTDPTGAIAEMARVAKPGGLILFLDEQLYPQATGLDRLYFHKVLSSHNVIHHCPVEAFPPELTDVTVSQVYQFYYLCTAWKGGPPVTAAG